MINIYNMRKLLLITCIVVFGFVAAGSISNKNNEEYKDVLTTYLNVSGISSACDVILNAAFESSSFDNYATIKEEMAKEAKDRLPEILLPVYEKHISVDDLRKAIEFYKTPEGKRMAASQDRASAETMGSAEKMAADLIPSVRETPE